MSDPSEPDFVPNMKSAMVQVVEMAKDQDRVCYLYRNKITREYEISFTYWKDWLFRAWPGGRKELSVDGSKYLELERR